jgi:imidazolonepropionase-like amidohydrolase
MRAISVSAFAFMLLFGGAPEHARGQAAPTGITVFESARVITGTGSAPIENATLVVDGARIVQLGAGAGIAVPAGAVRINLADKTLMPAIVDTHTHLSHTREELMRDLTRRAFYGVGAVMSLGQDSGDLLPMRSEVPAGGARYFSAGRGITAPEPGCSTAPYWITTETEGRTAVRELAARKVDIVKIYVDSWGDRYPKLTPELYGAIINEAHARGLRVTAHIRDLEDAKGLLRAGVDAFAHSVRTSAVDAEALALYRQDPNLVVVPTLPNRGVRADLSWLRDSLPAADLETLEAGNTDRPQRQREFAIQAGNLAKLNAAGVRIAFGTDGNSPWVAHVQMLDMVVAGMTPMQVIVAATRNSASFLRIADAGTLEPGKSADFIVLDANPLDDIANTRRIAAVYLRGQAVDRSAGRGGGMPTSSQICR